MVLVKRYIIICRMDKDGAENNPILQSEPTSKYFIHANY